MTLQNLTTVITGATGGLGRAAARRFHALGANLALVSTTKAKLDTLAEELGLPDERWLGVEADLTQADAAPRLLEAALERFGRADILLHFVGGWTGGTPITQTPDADLERLLANHAWSTFYLAKAFGEHLRESGRGRVVVVSSPSAAQPPADTAAYGAAKAAEEALVKSLAAFFGSRGDSGATANIIRVRTIDVKREKEKNPTERNAGWTTPEEIVAAVEYLCSEEARVLNGAVVPLYGEG